MTPWFLKGAHPPDAVATILSSQSTSYAQVLAQAQSISQALLNDKTDLSEARVLLQVEPGPLFVAALWGIWLAGGIAVPLHTGSTKNERAHIKNETQAGCAVVDSKHQRTFEALGLAALAVEQAAQHTHTELALPKWTPDRRALIVMTSGTTGSPKGVVHTHHSLGTQVSTLLEAWGWSSADRILSVLPLHHVHGLVNVLCCALTAGATCVFQRFEPQATWHRLSQGDITLFMAVPTLYTRLIDAFEQGSKSQQQRWHKGAAALRLMVSGSAALPSSVLHSWEKMTTHRLLERYGMTEIGMALSNPLQGERKPGFVGAPLKGVHTRLADENGRDVAAGQPGELWVQSPQLFCAYWNRDKETGAAFAGDWFKTGDMAIHEQGAFRILGRLSTDIIKSAGYKCSALEIEQVLFEHKAIKECAVLGVVDDDLGERIVVVVVLQQNTALTLEDLHAWLADKLSRYKWPRRLQIVQSLPTRSTGKIDKLRLRERL